MSPIEQRGQAYRVQALVGRGLFRRSLWDHRRLYGRDVLVGREGRQGEVKDIRSSVKGYIDEEGGCMTPLVFRDGEVEDSQPLRFAPGWNIRVAGKDRLTIRLEIRVVLENFVEVPR